MLLSFPSSNRHTHLQLDKPRLNTPKPAKFSLNIPEDLVLAKSSESLGVNFGRSDAEVEGG